ncbi:MAG: hypothetical protein ACLFUZ_04010 [Candidatus Micrarchaeia archaeon]
MEENITIPLKEYKRLIRYKRAVEALEEQIYEFRGEFVEEVKRISSEMDKGKKVSFKNLDELDAYLERE